MAAGRGEQAVGEHRVDAARHVDAADERIAPSRKVAGVLHVEHAVAQVAADERVGARRRGVVDVVVVRLAERRHDPPAGEIDHGVDVTRAALSDASVDDVARAGANPVGAEPLAVAQLVGAVRGC